MASMNKLRRASVPLQVSSPRPIQPTSTPSARLTSFKSANTRGWLSLFTRETELKRYRTGVLIASADSSVIKRVLSDLNRNFAGVALTYIAPFSYAELFEGRGEPMWIEDLKVSPSRSLASLRRR